MFKDKNGNEIKQGDFVIFETHSIMGRQFGEVTGINKFILSNGEVRYNGTVWDGTESRMIHTKDTELVA